MFDARTARTYLILACVIVAAPVIGLLASTMTVAPPADQRLWLARQRCARRKQRHRRSQHRSRPPASRRSAPPRRRRRPDRRRPLRGPRRRLPARDRAGDSDAATAAPTAAPAVALPERSDHRVLRLADSGQLGVLGRFPPDQLVTWLLGEAGIYDSLNGDRGVVPALDLIYSQAQSDPTANGLYLRYLDDATVRSYIALAEQHNLQLILDLQIGRGDILGEVQKIEPYLENPRVHLAIDPEYAVGPDGTPIETPGVITGDQINAVQAYLEGIVQAHNLPPKLFVIHQFMDQTVVDGDATQRFPDVDLVLNMDAYGDAQGKADKYHLFATRPYAEHHSFNVFLQHDAPVATEADVMRPDAPAGHGRVPVARRPPRTYKPRSALTATPTQQSDPAVPMLRSTLVAILALVLAVFVLPTAPSLAAPEFSIPSCAKQGAVADALAVQVPMSTAPLAAPPAITAKSAVVIDGDTGRVLYDLGAHDRRPRRA